jgi:hypothetical protein
MLAERGSMKETCEIYMRMYQALGRVDPQYQPYVLNNYGTTLHSTYYNE